MPRKRQAIGLSIPQARKLNTLQVLETDEQWLDEHCMLI